MISKEWKKTLDTKTLPLTEGLWAKITPKSSVVSGNYQLKLNVAAAYQAKLTNGKSVFDGYGIDPEAAPTTAQTAEVRPEPNSGLYRQQGRLFQRD